MDRAQNLLGKKIKIWNRSDIEKQKGGKIKMKKKHIEVRGCVVNIREELFNLEGKEVTSIEILPDQGWELDGHISNRVIKKEVNKK